jgi:transposase
MVELPLFCQTPFSHRKWLIERCFMRGKHYPDEFKIEAVRQVAGHGHSVADLASRLGMYDECLYFQGGLPLEHANDLRFILGAPSVTNTGKSHIRNGSDYGGADTPRN